MKSAEIDELLDRHGPVALMKVLEPFVSEARRERIDTVLSRRLASVEVAVEEPYDPHNAAAVVRSAEAFGAGGVHVVAAHERVLRARKTTAGTDHWLRVAAHSDLDAFRGGVGSRRVFGAVVQEAPEIDETPVDTPFCLLFGNEHRGLSEAARASCDGLFRIPLRGFAESLNLSVSAAISIRELSERRRRHLGSLGDLHAGAVDPEYSLERWRARYVLASVEDRNARAILKRELGEA